MVKPHRPHAELKPELTALAGQMVEQGGMGALNARRLAKAADVSVGTLYNLFGHLDGVARAVNLETVAMLYTTLETALGEAEPATEARLTALAEAYFDFAIAHTHRWDLLFRYRAETPSDGSLSAAEAELFALLAKATDGEGDPEMLRALWAAVHGVVELALNRRMVGREAGRERDHARLIVMAGLRGIAVLREEGAL